MASESEIIALVHGCAEGKSFAQYKIYNLYAKAMYSTALRLMRVREEAEDCMQEAFVDAFHKINTFKFESSFGSWLKRIVINKCLTKLRTQKMVFESIDEVPTIIDEENIDYEKEENSIQAIKEGILKLSNGYRTIISLHLFEGYDHAEIAQILEITEVTSRTQYIRGKAKLLEILKTNFSYLKT